MKFFSKALNSGFSIMFSIIIIITLTEIYNCLKRMEIAAVPAVILLVIFSFSVMKFLDKTEKIFKSKFKEDTLKYKKAFIYMALFLLFCQIMNVIIFDFTPKNDLSYICMGAKNTVLYGSEHLYDGFPERHKNYFSVYPNNHILYLVIYLLYKTEYFLTGNISNFLPTVINIIGLNISYILMYKCACLMYTPEKALVCAVKGLMFTPLITYSQFFYTDSMSMPFLTTAVYIYLRFRKSRESSPNNLTCKKMFSIILCGIILASAYKMKGSSAIFIPAMLIDIWVREKTFNKKIICTVTVISTFALSCILLGKTAQGILNINNAELEKNKFPLIHWVMMSADGKGGYQLEDFQYTRSYDGYDNKISADLERLIIKLKNQGTIGFVQHIINKISYTWKDGGFMAGYYFSSDFFRSPLFYIFAEIMHFSLLFSILKGFIIKIRSENDILSQNFIFKLTLLGITLFLLVWETRCRYLVSFFLLFILI